MGGVCIQGSWTLEAGGRRSMDFVQGQISCALRWSGLDVSKANVRYAASIHSAPAAAACCHEAHRPAMEEEGVESRHRRSN